MMSEHFVARDDPVLYCHNIYKIHFNYCFGLNKEIRYFLKRFEPVHLGNEFLLALYSTIANNSAADDFNSE